MKKHIALALCLIMLAALAACAGDTGGETTTGHVADTTAQTTQAATTTEAVTQPTAVTTTEAATTAMSADQVIEWLTPGLGDAMEKALTEMNVDISGGITRRTLDGVYSLHMEYYANEYRIWIYGGYGTGQAVLSADNLPFDMTDLTHFRGVTSYDLTGDFPVINTEKLNQLKSLQMLRIVDCPSVTQLPALDDLYNFSSLTLDNLPLEKLPELKKMSDITVENCPVEDLSPLLGTEGLVVLELIGVPATDLSALGQLEGLKSITLVDMDIDDISFVQGMELYTVVVRNTGVSDISALGGMPELTSITLSNNQITDVSPLADMTYIRWLHLEGNPIADTSVLSKLTETQITLE